MIEYLYATDSIESEQLKDFYAVDLLCDENLQPYYERRGMRRATGMFIRNYERQSGI